MPPKSLPKSSNKKMIVTRKKDKCEDMEKEQPKPRKARQSRVEDEIEKYSSNNDLIFPSKIFRNVIETIATDMLIRLPFSSKRHGQVFQLIQEIIEGLDVFRLRDALSYAIHAKRKTVMIKDIELSRKIRSKKFQI